MRRPIFKPAKTEDIASFLFQTNPLVWLYAIAVIVITLYNLTPPFNTYDTPYYINAGEHLLNNGSPDCLRTPVYPLFSMFCRWIGGNSSMNAIVTVFQSLLFLVSIYSLYDTCRRVVKRPYLSFAITLYYILIPAAGWANEILTESFSVSLCVILAHWIICLIQKATWKLNIAIPILLTTMVLMRPNFIAFFAILPPLWGYQWWKTKEHSYLYALLFCLIPIGSYLGYCKAYEQQYGIFNSTASFACCRYYNLGPDDNSEWTSLTPQDAMESAFISKILTARESGDFSYGPLCDYITETNDIITVLNVLDRIESRREGDLLRQRIRLFTSSSFAFMMPWTYNHGGLSSLIHQCCHFIAFPVSFLYAVVLVSGIAILVVVIRKRRLPIIAAVLWASVATQVVGIAISGSDSFDRLLMPVLPMALVLVGIGVGALLPEPPMKGTQDCRSTI